MDVIKEGLLLGIYIVVGVAFILLLIRLLDRLIQRSETLRNFIDTIIEKICNRFKKRS